MLNLDLPPDELPFDWPEFKIPYSILYELKQTVYKPIKAQILDTRPTHLDKENNVRTTSWRPDRSAELGVAWGQIAMLFFPTPSPKTVRAAVPEVTIHYDPIFAASPGDSNWYRFVVEELQEHQGGTLTRVLGRNEKRLAIDDALRRRARREMKNLGIDISDLQAGHPADSIINPYVQGGDVGTTYFFMEGRVNTEFGRQFSQQLNMLGVEKGGQFRVTFSGPWPDFLEFPPMAPPASSPGLK